MDLIVVVPNGGGVAADDNRCQEPALANLRDVAVFGLRSREMLDVGRACPAVQPCRRLEFLGASARAVKVVKERGPIAQVDDFRSSTGSLSRGSSINQTRSRRRAGLDTN